ncbi:hypothetical protein EZS27_005837 [termite gut metagenome]|uniref:DNA-binding protein n=1 Tax=termite gut metagenome TaxID=433724 RepID=A0A5J4SKG7_9ZZZZ
MKKDLVVSTIERQNVLNNKIAITAIREKLNVPALLFNDQYCFTKQMVADFYEVGVSTIERYLTTYENELKHNGYFLCRGKSLKEFKLQFGRLINEATKTTLLGLFNFRAFLNIGMLLSESEKAKQVRNVILDIVVASINERTGGGTKYINRRDADYYLSSAIAEVNYRKTLTSTIGRYVEGHPTMKYADITDYIYKAVFKENAKEYKAVLKLKENDRARDTMYAEVLLLIASFENGVGYEIEKAFKEKENQLVSQQEVYTIIDKFAEHPFQQPHLNDVRTKMASRDLGFRDALHSNIAEYVKALTPEEFDRFIGDKSIDFDTILEENKEVLKRLKQAENE